MSIDASKLSTVAAQALGSVGPVAVERLTRLTGGASRETWSFDAITGGADRASRHGLILRFGKSSYGDALGASGHAEYEFYNTLSAAGCIPIPAPIRYVADESIFGSDFFLVERIDGCETSQVLLDTADYAGVAPSVVRQIFRLGGRLSQFEWQKTPLAREFPSVAPDQVWRQQLQYWARVISTCATEPQPLVNYLINQLAASPPPPPKKVVVLSGDYRLGNFLYDKSGQVRGWLDWEMGHLGDPLEDLTWALMSNWRRDDSVFPGGLSPQELIEEWRDASQLSIDPDAFQWWSLFQHVKAHGIWQAAVKASAEHPGVDIKQALIAFACPVLQDKLLIDDLGWIR